MTKSNQAPPDRGPASSAGQASPAPLHGRWVLAAAILASSLAFIDGTAVTVALPAIQNGFHTSANQIQWVIEIYALFLASLLLVGGSLGDLYGRRLIFLIGVLLFTAGSIGCGVAPSIVILLVARGLQGVGAAMLVPGSLSLISAVFPEDQRGKAIGIWSGFSAMTAAIGPVLGGLLVDHFSWRWVFFLNLPLSVAILAISWLRVPESRNEAMHQRLDWAGALLITVALGGITFSLVEGHRAGSIVTITAVVGTLALIAFLFVEQRVPAPMLPLQLFRSATFAGANLLTLFLYTALNGLLFFFPLNLIQVQHYSATAAGAALLPLILLLFLLSGWSGSLLHRYGARAPLTVGSLIAAAGFAMAALPGVGGSYWTTFFPAVMVLGTGMAISVAPLTTAVMNSVSVAQSGVASGVNNAISRLASLLSVAVFGVILSSAFRTDLSQRLDRLPVTPAERSAVTDQSSRLAAIQSGNPHIDHAVAESFVYGFRRILWVAVGLSVASAACAQLLRGKTREHETVTAEEPQAKSAAA